MIYATIIDNQTRCGRGLLPGLHGRFRHGVDGLMRKRDPASPSYREAAEGGGRAMDLAVSAPTVLRRRLEA